MPHGMYDEFEEILNWKLPYTVRARSEALETGLTASDSCIAHLILSVASNAHMSLSASNVNCFDTYEHVEDHFNIIENEEQLLICNSLWVGHITQNVGVYNLNTDMPQP